MLGIGSRLGSAPSSGVYRALAQRDFRLLWLGSIASTFAMQMQIVARGWLTYDMTESPLALTWVLLSFMLPSVAFSLIGGVLADRIAKKPIMVFAQLVNVVSVGSLAVIIYTGNITFWHFIYFGVISGSAMSIGMPTRTSIIPELVDRNAVVSSLALQSSTFNFSRIVGPALAGTLIAIFAAGDTTSTRGVGLVYFVITTLVVCSVSLTAMMNYRGEPVRMIKNSIAEDLSECFRFLRRARLLIALLLMTIVPTTFGFAVILLLPVFTKEVLGGGPAQLGLLSMALGIGAVVGSMGLAFRGEIRKKGRMMFHAAFLWIVLLVGYAFSESLYIAMIFLGLAGVAGALLTTLNMSTMQLLIPQELRGRVNSLIMMAHGLMPLGVIPVGFVAEFFSIQTALLVGVVALLLSLAGIRLAYPELWRLGCIRTPYDPPGQERPEVPSGALAVKAN